MHGFLNLDAFVDEIIVVAVDAEVEVGAEVEAGAVHHADGRSDP